jgi:hypothetical protein
LWRTTYATWRELREVPYWLREMPHRTLLCMICRETCAQVTPEVPDRCPRCQKAAHWRVVEDWEVTEQDAAFLRSIKIAAE